MARRRRGHEPAGSGRRPILVISQVPPPVHGSTVMTRRLLDTFVRAGRPAVLVDRRFSRRVADIGRPSWGKGVAAVGLVGRLLRALVVHRPPVVVHFVTNRSGAFLVDVVLAAVMRLMGVRVVQYVHTNGFRVLAERGTVWRAVVAFLLTTAEQVVVLGPSMRADVAPWVADDRIRVIPNASDSVLPDPDPDPDSSGRQVLFFSNLLPEKGAHIAVDLGVRLCSRADDVTVVLAGAEADPDYSAGLRDVIDRAGLGQRIRMVGPVAQSARQDLLAASDVLLFPSTYPYEAQPLSVIEAMASGLPVVAFATGGIPDLVLDGRTGQLIDPGDVEAMFRQLEALLADPARLAEQSAAARQEHARHHSSAAFSAAWDDLLHSVEGQD